MARLVAAALLLAAGPSVAAALGEVCRPADPNEGSCPVDGVGCQGEAVEFQPVELNVSHWRAGVETRLGGAPSYALVGQKDTWQMYLHGPLIREPERQADSLGIPPVYVFATWMDRIYRFENFSQATPGMPLRATQKLVGHALAPSTAWPIEEPGSRRLKGLLLAEGQPWWMSNLPMPREIYKGGVEYLPTGRQAKCTQIFPEDFPRKMFGQVVNTVDCHRGAGVCFFTVWKFYDDQWPIWTNMSEMIAPDCLYYCITDRLDDRPTCKKTGVVVNERGERVCHKDGKGAVHGMTIGNTDPKDPTKFDIFLVFTGGATFTGGHSSMHKVAVQVVSSGEARDLRVLHTAPFAQELFQGVPPKGQDVGGDHAWVDDTGKWIWVSTFRESAAGVHMLSYETGQLMYSVSGIAGYVKGQYAYSAGIHGVGTLGKPGSYLAVATSACHDVKMCAPMPWNWPMPKVEWAAGVFFIIDLADMPKMQPVYV